MKATVFHGKDKITVDEEEKREPQLVKHSERALVIIGPSTVVLIDPDILVKSY